MNFRRATITLVWLTSSIGCFAADVLWDNGGIDNKFETAENWSTDIIPGPSDKAWLNGASSTILYDSTTGTHTVNNLELQAGLTDMMIMSGGHLTITTRLGIHANKLWLTGDAILQLDGSNYGRNNNNSGIYFSTTESTTKAKFIWIGKSDAEFKATAGIWVDGTQMNASNFDTYFTYDATVGAESISLKQTTVEFVNGGVDTKWETAENWSTSAVPGASHKATVSNASYSIAYDEVSGNTTLDNLELINGNTDIMTMNGGQIKIVSRLGIHAQKLWLKGDSELLLGNSAIYVRNNNSSGVYFSTTESTLNAKFIWIGKSKDDFKSTTGIWVDGTQMNASNFDTLFTYDPTPGQESISLLTNTPAFGLNFVQSGTELSWTVEDEVDVKEYQVINNSTDEVIAIIGATGLDAYSVTLPEGVTAKVVVVDNSGFTQTFYPENGDVRTVAYSLSKGWNLISITTEDADLAKLNNAIAGDLWIWDGEVYQVTTDPQPTQGVWVYAPAATEVTVSGTKSDAEIKISRGWNLVGPVENSPAPAEATVIYNWNDIYESIATEQGTLIQGVGYWIFVL